MKEPYRLLILSVALSCGCHGSRLSSSETAAPPPSVGSYDSGPSEPALMARLKQQCDVVYPKHTERGGVRCLTGLSVWNASEGAFATLNSAQGIEELEFVATDLRTPAFAEVGKLTSLKCFRTENCNLLPGQLTTIQNLKELEDLELQFTIFEESSEKRAQLLGDLSPEEAQRRDALKRSGLGDHIIQAALLTDRAIPNLRHLTSLKTLRLQNTFFSAGGLEHLKPLVDLEVADLGPINLTGATTLPLQGMTKLRSLRYFNADDDVAAVLSEISSLEDLDVWSGEVTDIGAGHLINLKKLQRLQIRGNRMTDQGLETLSQLPQLRYLDLSYVKKMTSGGIARFRKLRPDVEIKYSPSRNP